MGEFGEVERTQSLGNSLSPALGGLRDIGGFGGGLDQKACQKVKESAGSFLAGVSSLLLDHFFYSGTARGVTAPLTIRTGSSEASSSLSLDHKKQP